MILVLGANGQLGHDLSQRFSNKGVKFLQVTRSDVDIANLDALELFLDDKDFSVLVNCTSYHKTDEVEDNAPNAFLINSSAPMLMAQICQKKGAKMFHISTDYVFGGNEESKPLDENACTAPLNIYGSSKLQGESLVKKNCKDSYVFRVASLFGVAGASGKGGNFVEAIIRNAKEKGEIKVVDDQIMSPTSTNFIANVIAQFCEGNQQPGTYHVVNKGEVSWFEFAKKICQMCKIDVVATPIKADELNLKAKRPSYSALNPKKLLDNGVEVPTYEYELEKYLKLKGHL